MNRIDFPALNSNQHRFTWNRNSFDSPWRFDHSGRGILHACAGRFDTYGDGAVQHSVEIPVLVQDALIYMASLAAFLIENRDPETLDCIENDWPKPYYEIGHRSVSFAMSLKYKEGKTQYFNATEQKKSSAEAKQYDKRWEPVPEWANGSFDSVCALCVPKHHDALERYADTTKCAEFFEILSGSYCSSNFKACEMAGIIPRDSDRHEFNQISNDFASAFHVVDSIVKSVRDLDSAKRSFSCLDNNYISRLNQGAPAA